MEEINPDDITTLEEARDAVKVLVQEIRRLRAELANKRPSWRTLGNYVLDETTQVIKELRTAVNKLPN